MSVAHSSSNFPSVSVVPQLLPMLLAVEVLLGLSLAVCKLFPMFLNLLVETMAIPIIADITIDHTKRPAKATVNHMPLTVKLHNSNQLFQCTMVVRQLLEAMVELDPNSLECHIMLVALNLTLVLQVNPCKVSKSLANR